MIFSVPNELCDSCLDPPSLFHALVGSSGLPLESKEIDELLSYLIYRYNEPFDDLRKFVDSERSERLRRSLIADLPTFRTTTRNRL